MLPRYGHPGRRILRLDDIRELFDLLDLCAIFGLLVGFFTNVAELLRAVRSENPTVQELVSW